MFLGKLHHKPKRRQDVLLGLATATQLANECLNVETGGRSIRPAGTNLFSERAAREGRC